MPDSVIYLKNYQVPVFTIDTVDLNVDLYDDHALVHSTLTLTRQTAGNLHLCGEALELVSIAMNGVKLASSEYQLADNALIIEQCPNSLTLEIITRIYPQNNTELSGLYRSKELFCTQCEAEGFRRITYFLDRPDVLAKYTTRITADKKTYPILLSNGNLTDSGDLENGRHWALWSDPFKKPCYLFALVAGNLACLQDSFVTCSGRKVDLRIYVEPGNEDKCAYAMESVKKAMRWDEKEYGREYDLDIFMIVAVSDFNMGAMENKGLNIFNSKYILARPDTATDDDYIGVESVVGHEYFHNWTGNRVTCRDWFQLSLKEGLTVFRDQEFSRDMNSRDVFRVSDVKALLATQFPEDAGSLAHAVRPESYLEINNFYTATIYNKGAEVIRMQQTLLGKEGFRKGMDLYFKRHDGQAVTIDNFVASMEDANNKDLSQFMLWYSQAGTPQVKVMTSYSNDTLTLTLTQSCLPTPSQPIKKPFHIPLKIALFDSLGNKMPIAQEVLELTESEQQFTFPNLAEKPVLSILREFSAPIRIENELTQDELLFLLRHETDGYAKWNAAQHLVKCHLQDCLSKPVNQWDIPLPLVEAFKKVLTNEALDSDLRAELLTPPAFEEVIAGLQAVDVGLVEQVRDVYRQQLGQSLYTQISQLYTQLWQDEDHNAPDSFYKHKKLRNLCLNLMMKANETASLATCIQQYQHAKTMTDKIASFALLVNCKDNVSRKQAIEDFYKLWSQDELVLDKWFAIQATSELPDTLEKVKKLMQDPAFNFKNPNKVRALIGAFCQANPRNFHAADGSGYSFLTEILIQIDKFNPQIAARLATPFTRGLCYNQHTQDLVKQQLTILASKKLSKDLREVIDKSLSA